MYLTLEPLLAVLSGLLVLLIPRFLSYIVGVYLILIGILGMIR